MPIQCFILKHAKAKKLFQLSFPLKVLNRFTIFVPQFGLRNFEGIEV